MKKSHHIPLMSAKLADLDHLPTLLKPHSQVTSRGVPPRQLRDLQREFTKLRKDFQRLHQAGRSSGL